MSSKFDSTHRPIAPAVGGRHAGARRARRPDLTALWLLATACAGAGTGPAPLPAAAVAYVRQHLATFDGPDGPSSLHGSPGSVTDANGESVRYDRYLLIGTELGRDRGQAFAEFVRELELRGGSYRTLERMLDGRPSKVLVDVDGQRIVVSVQKW
jgi:hypothetical protein